MKQLCEVGRGWTVRGFVGQEQDVKMDASFTAGETKVLEDKGDVMMQTAVADEF